MRRTGLDRLAVKTLDQRFRHELEAGFETAPRVSEGILDLAKEVFSLDAVSGDGPARLRPGQIRQVIAATGAPHGRPLCDTDMVEVTWTLDAGEEDLDVLRRCDQTALRQVRILRLIDEALSQGGEPTQEDLAKALGVCPRTIRSDVAALEAEGYLVATRGKRQGIGRGQSHKVLIVELYLKRHTYTEIMRRTRHSAYAIKRYLHTFGRVVMLARKGLQVHEIAHVVAISEGLAQEYLELYQQCNKPEHQDRLEEMVHMISGGTQRPAPAPKGGAG
jgi:DNA-binding Lrp family transcriptional regulator